VRDDGPARITAGNARESRKVTTIRHNGKKLNDILDAHAKYHKGQPGGERADLSGANLSRQDLRKRDLTGAILVGCNLQKADLRGSKLSFADLSKSDLRKADLRNCDFTETRLEGADLSEADFERHRTISRRSALGEIAQNDSSRHRFAPGKSSRRGFFRIGPRARQLPRNRFDRR